MHVTDKDQMIIIKDHYYMHKRNLYLNCMSCFQNHFFFLKQVLFGIINKCVRPVVYLCGLSDLWPPFPLAVFFWRGVSVAWLNECNMSLSRGARTIFSSSVVEKNMFVSHSDCVSYSRQKCVITSSPNPAWHPWAEVQSIDFHQLCRHSADSYIAKRKRS